VPTFLLKQHLQMIVHLEKTVTQFEAQIEAALEPFRDAVKRLMTIPGVSATAAHVIIAEIGVDMSRFATVGHLRSWAGLCPQLNESAGKVRSRRLRKGARGSKPCWFNALGRPLAVRTTTSMHSFYGSEPAAVQKRRSLRWRPRSLPPRIVCSATKGPIAISDPNISRALTKSEPLNA
jgi:transposase